MLKRGPEIKLPPLKVPTFLSDLYQDLRERHLLPLVAILLIGIVAVPIVFGGGSSEADEAQSPSSGSGAAAGEGGGELVAKSAPGLRQYQDRLDELKAKDPFEQQYTEARAEGGGSGSGGGGSGGGGGGSGDGGGTGGGADQPPPPLEGGGGGESPSPAPPPIPSPGPGPGPGPGEGTGTPKLTYYSYAIDVRVTTFGERVAKGKPKTTVRRNLPELTMLPSRKTPAAIFVGATKDEKKALFVISSDVEALFGDGKCVLGSRRCEMLMLEPGLPQTFVYGGAGRTFRVELLKVKLVESDKINRAPLGETKQNRQKKKKKKGGE